MIKIKKIHYFLTSLIQTHLSKKWPSLIHTPLKNTQFKRSPSSTPYLIQLSIFLIILLNFIYNYLFIFTHSLLIILSNHIPTYLPHQTAIYHLSHNLSNQSLHSWSSVLTTTYFIFNYFYRNAHSFYINHLKKNIVIIHQMLISHNNISYCTLILQPPNHLNSTITTILNL